MKRCLIIVALAAALSACGVGAPPAEEVSATWTSGDDAPLEGEGEAE